MIDAPANDQARAWTFDELVQDARSLIPAYAPSWTNHNPSDPGITLLELLAYFSEILAYRALRITPDAKLHFLRLLEGRAASPSDPLLGAPTHLVEQAIAARVQALSHLQCAVTPGDFERLAIEAAATLPDGTRNVLAKCVPGMDLRRGHGGPADVSIVLGIDRDSPAEPTDRLCCHVEADLTPRCLLTTRVHVVPAAHLDVFVACHLSPTPGISLATAGDQVDAALMRRFDPMRSGQLPEDAGPFGRPVHMATIAAAIDRVAEVDYVENITVRRIAVAGAIVDEDSLVGIRIGVVARIGVDARLGGLASVAIRRLQTDHTGEAETIFVQPWELARVRLARDALQGRGDDGSAVNAGNRRRG